MADVDPTTDVTTASYDAEQLVEDIAAGEQESPKVNVDADYERSKQFDVADIDRNEDGNQAATSGSAPSGTTTGDPNAFRKMAKEVDKPTDEK